MPIGVSFRVHTIRRNKIHNTLISFSSDLVLLTYQVSSSCRPLKPRLEGNSPRDVVCGAAPEVQKGNHGWTAVGALEGEGAGGEAGDEGCALLFCEGVVEHYCALFC